MFRSALEIETVGFLLDSSLSSLWSVVSPAVGCVMDMRHPDGKRVMNVYLPRGSLLIMEGAARYEWSHGIASRKTDMVRRAINPFSS